MSTSTMAFEPLLNPVEAAALLQIHEKTLIKLARDGKVPAVRLGRLWRFRASAIEQWIETSLAKVGPAKRNDVVLMH
jgi:excisionase family DNA binding protein